MEVEREVDQLSVNIGPTYRVWSVRNLLDLQTNVFLEVSYATLSKGDNDVYRSAKSLGKERALEATRSKITAALV